MRRAISSAYYGVFHFALAALADEFVGVSRRSSSRYGLIYRSLDHRTLKDIRGDISKPTPPHRYAPYLPTEGFGADIQVFARTTIDLHEKRHRADFNPEPRYRSPEATLAIGSARSAVQHFEQASQERKKAFLTLPAIPTTTEKPSKYTNGKIRHTVKKQMFVVRGHPFTHDHNNTQMYGLSAIVVESPHFLGEDFSWGDMQILPGSRKGGRLDLTLWIAIDTNHHLTFAVQEVEEFERNLMAKMTA